MQNNDIEIIKTARDHIASGKWWKGESRDYGGDREKVCAVTALYDTSYRLGLNQGEADRVIALVERFVPIKRTMFDEFRLLAVFNDHSSTTLSDVTDLFDKALAELGGL